MRHGLKTLASIEHTAKRFPLAEPFAPSICLYGAHSLILPSILQGWM